MNNVRVADDSRLVTAEDLIANRYVVLRRGRRENHLVRFS